MKKNVASQRIGAQLVSATDGSAFTGTVTVYVTGDAGTQAIGSVGSGVCTHEGNGYHTYAPAQAETNYDLVAFTFIGTGAVPATVQVYTAFPQTGDSFGLIGATGSGLTSLATQVSVNTIDDFLDTEIAAIKAKTDNLPASPAAVSDIPTVGQIADQVWDEAIAGHLTAGTTGLALNSAGSAGDPWSTALPGAYGAGTAGQIVGDYLNAAVGDIPTAVENADALLGRNVSGGSSTGRTVKQVFHFIRNKWVVAAGTLTVYDTDDTTTSWTAAVTGTAGADPVTGVDP